MVGFLPIALLGYLLNSTSTFLSKFVVNNSLPNPISYTFYVALSGLLVLVLIPFGFIIPNHSALLFGLVSALAFLAALLLFYSSLFYDEPIVVAPIFGTFNSIFTFLLGYFLFQEAISGKQILAILILILGLAIFSSTHLFKSKLQRKHFLVMAVGGMCAAISALTLRQSILQTNFITGLILCYVLASLASLSFLLIPKYQRLIFQAKVVKNSGFNKTSLWILSSEIIGAAGGFVISYGYSLAPASIVNSLQGIQYIFLLVVALLLPKHLQHLIGEDYIKKRLTQKIIGSIVIGIGLGILALT